MQSIDLIWLGPANTAPEWPHGQVLAAAPAPKDLQARIEQSLLESKAQAWLFWDPALGAPDPATITRALALPGDLWHAGLRLGTSGLPAILDFVSPNGMHSRDTAADIESSSWRLSLRACLVTTEVLRQMGNLSSEFDSLDAAALDMGHRYLAQGVLMRHVPWLVPASVKTVAPQLSLDDELRFARYRFTHFWSRWALMRAVMTGHVSAFAASASWRKVQSLRQRPPGTPFKHPQRNEGVPTALEAVAAGQARVSVLIPTLERYPYLRKLLEQLREQTVKPLEIFVVDQTPLADRDWKVAEDFADLPLTVLHRDQAGQCSSRNAGLALTTGDYILLLDDDVEVGPDYIKLHLQTLQDFGADVSSGPCEEVGAGPLPDEFKFVRCSDVFPAGNTMIRRETLRQAGLFDMAYEKGQRADGDLGMRVYLNGSLMVLDPSLVILHHRAPRGGLRVHKARVTTYASSRQNLFQRHLPSVSEIYFARRYFTQRQLREVLWLRAFGTLSMRGSKSAKILKNLISGFYLPQTWWRIRQRSLQASQMLETFPQIPALKDPDTATAKGANAVDAAGSISQT